jgi:hypothetical protein
MNKIYAENKITAEIRNSKINYASLTLHQQLIFRYVKNPLMLIVLYCIKLKNVKFKIFFSPEPEEAKNQYFGRRCVTIFAVEPQGQRSLPKHNGLTWVPL